MDIEYIIEFDSLRVPSFSSLKHSPPPIDSFRFKMILGWSACAVLIRDLACRRRNNALTPSWVCSVLFADDIALPQHSLRALSFSHAALYFWSFPRCIKIALGLDKSFILQFGGRSRVKGDVRMDGGMSEDASLVHRRDFDSHRIPCIQQSPSHVLVGAVGLGQFRIVRSRPIFRHLGTRFVAGKSGSGRALIKVLDKAKSSASALAALISTGKHSYPIPLSLALLLIRSVIFPRLTFGLHIPSPSDVCWVDHDHFINKLLKKSFHFNNLLSLPADVLHLELGVPSTFLTCCFNLISQVVRFFKTFSNRLFLQLIADSITNPISVVGSDFLLALSALNPPNLAPAINSGQDLPGSIRGWSMELRTSLLSILLDPGSLDSFFSPAVLKIALWSAEFNRIQVDLPAEVFSSSCLPCLRVSGSEEPVAEITVFRQAVHLPFFDVAFFRPKSYLLKQKKAPLLGVRKAWNPSGFLVLAGPLARAVLAGRLRIFRPFFCLSMVQPPPCPLCKSSDYVDGDVEHLVLRCVCCSDVRDWFAISHLLSPGLPSEVVERRLRLLYCHLPPDRDEIAFLASVRASAAIPKAGWDKAHPHLWIPSNSVNPICSPDNVLSPSEFASDPGIISDVADQRRRWLVFAALFLNSLISRAEEAFRLQAMRD